jgi:hypothetical protein
MIPKSKVKVMVILPNQKRACNMLNLSAKVKILDFEDFRVVSYLYWKLGGIMGKINQGPAMFLNSGLLEPYTHGY